MDGREPDLFAKVAGSIFIVVAFIGMGALGILLQAAMQPAPTTEVAEAHEPPCGDTWYVLPGDTPWAIASRCYPGEHTGERAHEIVTLNDVDAGSLHVGDVLTLPERGR